MGFDRRFTLGLIAWIAALAGALAATALRGEVLPERVPTEGLLILRDGEPGEPEVTLSPLAYHYQHRAEIESVVQGTKSGVSLELVSYLQVHTIYLSWWLYRMQYLPVEWINFVFLNVVSMW